LLQENSLALYIVVGLQDNSLEVFSAHHLEKLSVDLQSKRDVDNHLLVVVCLLPSIWFSVGLLVLGSIHGSRRGVSGRLILDCGKTVRVLREWRHLRLGLIGELGGSSGGVKRGDLLSDLDERIVSVV
jgi:hypothetical protein